MKNKLILSIAMSSAVCFNTNLACASTEEDTALVAAIATTSTIEREEVHGGKCAAGKCGTLKAYEASKLTHDPQCRLVHARDGKCGLSGKGVAINTNAVIAGDCAGGVCGQ